MMRRSLLAMGALWWVACQPPTEAEAPAEVPVEVPLEVPEGPATLPLSGEDLFGIPLIEGARVDGNGATIDHDYDAILATYAALLTGHERTDFGHGAVFEALNLADPTVYVFRDGGDGVPLLTVVGTDLGPLPPSTNTAPQEQGVPEAEPRGLIEEIPEDERTGERTHRLRRPPPRPYTPPSARPPVPEVSERDRQRIADAEARLGRSLVPDRWIGGRWLTVDERIAMTPSAHTRGQRFDPPPDSLGE